jgi:hypothetical protein
LGASNNNQFVWCPSGLSLLSNITNYTAAGGTNVANYLLSIQFC